VDTVLNVKTKNTVDGFEADVFGMRGKGRGLAEGATETAAARGEQYADGKRPTTGETEFSDKRRMLDIIDRGA